MFENEKGIRPLLAIAVLLTAAVSFGCGSEPEEPPRPAASEDPPPAPAAAPSVAMIAIANARAPLPGVVTGGQPTEEQIEQAGSAGYRTVVSLRTPGEDGYWDEAPKVEELGMRFVSIPVPVPDGLTVDNARRLFEVMEDTENHPVMVHCGSGNRIGALFALKAFHVDGEDADAALEVGREAGLTWLEDDVRKRFEPPGE